MKKSLFFSLLFSTGMLSGHPFDPLSEAEHIQAVSLVQALPEIAEVCYPKEGLFDLVVVKEPKKQEVLDYEAGIGPLPAREALVTFYKAVPDKYLEYTINLDSNEITNKRQIAGGRPGFACIDDVESARAVLVNQDFIDAMAARGIDQEDFDNIYFDVSVDGRLNNLNKCVDCEGPNAVLKEGNPHSFFLTPFWNDGKPWSTAAYIQPIEGVVVFVDRRFQSEDCENEDEIAATVIKVVDTGVITPIAKGNLNWDRGARQTIKPLAVSMPEGDSIIIDENDPYLVKWDKWSFRYAMHPVTNLILYEIKYDNKSVLYRANIAELLTGYGSPEFPSNMRNYFDWNEYPARDFCPPMVKGLDTPPYARMFPATFTYGDASTSEIPNLVSMYEEDGDVLWRHTEYPCSGYSCCVPLVDGECPDPDNNQFCCGQDEEGNGLPCTSGRRARQLVIRTLAVISNYDYLVSWTFHQDGKIDVEVQATGVMECQGTKYTRVNKNIKFGSLVKENVVGVNHYHILSARLDFDIDGQKNVVHEKTIELVDDGKCVDGENPCGNSFGEVEIMFMSEQEAVRDHDFNKFKTWVIENHDSQNFLGHNRSYEIIPFPVAHPLVNRHSRVGKRGAFLLHNLYVTRYHDDELSVAGDYLVEQPKDLGLPKYIEDNESIYEEDLVVWYQTGFGHAPITEQYPIMTVEKVKFSIVPHHFFDENPALDVDKNTLICCESCDAGDAAPCDVEAYN